MSPELGAAIGAAISAAEGPFFPSDFRPVPGGCIARNLCVGDGRRRYFVKVQAPDHARLLAEADGLAALARCPQVVVPRVVALGLADGAGFLTLEWLDLDEAGGELAGDQQLADAIAALHAIEYPRYGWDIDNWIGATPQANAWCDDWCEFFVSRRLQPQLAGAECRLRLGAGSPLLRGDVGDRLSEAVRAGLAGHRPRASLLHGDLWSGNVGAVNGKPALFDPAVYAGDGESDLAMAALFGGFSRRFFARYAELNPAGDGAEWRRSVYQLYHVLNHVNLFGAGYLGQARALIERVLAGP